MAAILSWCFSLFFSLFSSKWPWGSWKSVQHKQVCIIIMFWFFFAAVNGLTNCHLCFAEHNLFEICCYFSCRKLCCTGEKGLLTKILETLIECPPTAPLRWLQQLNLNFLILEPQILHLWQTFAFKTNGSFWFHLFLCRFWLSRAIEGFLRGRASVGDQLFLIKRGLLEVIAFSPCVDI